MNRGIVISAGGIGYLANAWVCVRVLRHLGCRLPVEIWCLDELEFDETFFNLIAAYGVTYRIASNEGPQRPIHGWELKAFSLVHTSFSEVLLLDADNVPVLNPEFLFETEEFKTMGAIFWPDLGRLNIKNPIWQIVGIPFRDEPEWESGQIVVDRLRCMNALRLAWAYNRNRKVFYQHVYGDKETFHLAFRKLELPVAIPQRGPELLKRTLLQYTFDGELLFQHRARPKWRLFGANEAIPGFLFHEECLRYLDELRRSWNVGLKRGGRFYCAESDPDVLKLVEELKVGQWSWRPKHMSSRTISFGCNGLIQPTHIGQEVVWDLVRSSDGREWLLRVVREFGNSSLLLRISSDLWQEVEGTTGYVGVKLSRVIRSA